MSHIKEEENLQENIRRAAETRDGKQTEKQRDGEKEGEEGEGGNEL